MSHLQKDFIKARLAKLPQLPALRDPLSDASAAGDDDGDGHPQQPLDELDDDEGREGADGLGQLGAPARAPRRARPAAASPRHPPVAAVPDYFAQALSTRPSSSSTAFQGYYTPPRDPKGGRGTVVVCHHGGGEGALGFAAFAQQLTALSKGELGVLAWDCRGHGDTPNPTPDDLLDLALPTLVDDFVACLSALYPEPSQAPDFLLVGHSMGAPPVVHAVPKLKAKGFRVIGAVVLDVVEGSALDSLSLMPDIIRARPSTFKDVQEGIDWHISTQTYRNPLSAQLSVPSLLKQLSSSSLPPSTVHPSSLAFPADPPPPVFAPGTAYTTWRTDLGRTEPFWEGWYTGLSRAFLALGVPRMLVLAGQDRMDKELMIGQMQGKFQHVVLQHCGHHIHQDDPRRLAELVGDFWRRARGGGVDLSKIRKVGQ